MWDRRHPHDVRERLFEGTGCVRVFDLKGARAIPPFAAVLACELEPMGGIGPHVQPHCPEIVIIIDGEGTARVGDEICDLLAGAVVYVPLGLALSLKNASRERPLRYLIVKAAR